MKLIEQNALTHDAMMAYMAGTLSVEEKQQFEQLLKNDPFAQDALEGLQSTNQLITNKAVTNINKKVRERAGLQHKKSISLHWATYAWAAVLVGLLIGVGVVMVNILGKDGEQIAMDKKAPVEAEQSLFEEKQAEQTLVPAENQVNTDSIFTVSGQAEVASVNSQVAEAATIPSAELSKQPSSTTSEIANAARKENTAASKTLTAAGGATAPAIVPPVNQKLSTTDRISETGKSKTGEVDWKDNRSDTKATETIAEKKVAAKTAAPKDEKAVAADPMPAVPMAAQDAGAEEGDYSNSVTMDGAMKNFNSGNYKKASQDFDLLLKQQPQNADALYFGGISDYINGNNKKSEQNFDKLLKSGNKFQEGSKWYKANILLKKGKKEEAKKLLDELAGSNGSYKERAIKKKAELEF